MNSSDPKDMVFATPRDGVTPFSFNQEVADVFDDMITRSVPFYRETQALLLDVLPHYVKAGEMIYDVGCSTGTTLLGMSRHEKLSHNLLCGLDNSAPMIQKAASKLRAYGMHQVELCVADATEFDFKPAGAAVSLYTLQFIPLPERKKLLKKIYQSLSSGGVLFVAEKIATEDTNFQDKVTELYYDFKRRNGYSELEISQKREALENVLVPLTPTANMQLFTEAGFTHSEMIFRWYNFATFVAIKS